MKPKQFGALLMILGTCVGAGMLALPVVTAQQHILTSVTQLAGAWFLMTFGALCMLEVNLSLPERSNMATMAQKTLGSGGEGFTWFIYLLLLYALLCAYVAATSGVIDGLVAFTGRHIPHWLDTLLAVALLASIVTGGIHRVDWFNRFLMSAKLIALLVLFVVLMPFIHSHYLNLGGWTPTINSFFVMITSFGFAIIIPSLRIYFREDHRSLKEIVLIGSLAPLVLYILWIVAIQAVMPRQGTWGLITINHAQQSVSQLMQALDHYLPIQAMNTIAQFFIAVSAITSFLGVSLSVSDFWADGLQITKTGWKQVLIMGLTFLPPTALVLLWPHLFIVALHYAGLLCIILLVILPTLMAYRCRYALKMTHNRVLPAGKWLFYVILVLGLALIVVAVSNG